MHVDGIGHLPQREWPQMGDALAKKAVLLLHNLGGDLDDGALSLIHGFDEPVRIGHAVV